MYQSVQEAVLLETGTGTAWSVGISMVSISGQSRLFKANII